MDNPKLKILFLGAGIFAVPVLRALCASSKLDLVAVVTQPDKLAGRKRQLTPSPLGQWADAQGIRCLRVASVNTPEFLDQVHAWAPDLVVVVAFGQILRDGLLNAAPLGCLNVHASILPKYRGASPIKSAMLNGDPETGVTFMKMERGLDSGPVYEIHRMPIRPGVINEVLEEELAVMAGEKIENCILRLAANGITPCPQQEDGVILCAKIKKTDGSVNWNEDADALERKVRAYHRWPGMAFRAQIKNRCIIIKIMQASTTSWQTANAVPGQITAYGNNQLMVQCGRGSLLLERIIPEGKKEMSVSDFLNGSHLSVGEIFLNGPEPQNPQTTPAACKPESPANGISNTHGN